MTKTMQVLLALALVWLTAWGIAAYSMARAGTQKLAEAEHVSTPATELAPGAEIRVEGVIAEGPTTTSPFKQEPCLAAVTTILIGTTYTDVHGKVQYDYERVAERRVGPPNIEIIVGDARIELPLERWAPVHERSEGIPELPARLGVTPEEIARAKEQLHDGSGGGFTVSETTIVAGTAVFVAGTLEDRDDALRLAADPVLGQVVLYGGSQAANVEDMQGSGGGLRIAAAILGFGVGPLPLLIVGLALLRRRS